MTITAGDILTEWHRTAGDAASPHLNRAAAALHAGDRARAAGELELAASHRRGQDGERLCRMAIDLVGAEGYIHGFVCVRPPCGPKPARVTAASLTVKNDGTVVHAKSGWAVGSITKHPTDRGLYNSHQADGKVRTHTSKQEALKAVATAANKYHADAGSAPKPSAGAKPEPASSPGGPERAGNQVWSTGEGTAALTPAEKNSIANVWYGRNFYATNGYLRRDPFAGGLAGDPRSIIDRYTTGVDSDAERQKYIADIGTFQTAISKAAPFTSDVTLLRGVNHPEAIFGPPGSTIGKSVTDKGFTSATSNMGVADSYSHGFGGKTALITIHARAGSRALKVDPDVWNRVHTKKQGQTPPGVLQEYTFAPGTSYKILADTLGADGVRRMDMEVTP